MHNLPQRQISLYSKVKLYILDDSFPNECVKLNIQMDIQLDTLQALPDWLVPRPISIQADV